MLPALAEVPDQRADHPLRRRPRAVRGADCLDDVLEDRRAPEHAACSRRRPGELEVGLDPSVEVRQVLVQTEHVPHRRKQRGALSIPERFAEYRDSSEAGAGGGRDHRARWRAPDGERRREGASVLVDDVRRQRGDAVRHDRPPEVDGLAAGSDKRKLERVGDARRGRSRSRRSFSALAHLVVRS
jgi:hypothetical protein